MIFYCSPPSGTVVGVVFCFPQVPFPPVIPPAVIGSSPPSGTGGLDAALRRLDAALRRLDAALRRFYYIQVSQVTSGPRRGPIFNNRWWNDHRSWNLRTTNSREKASPKGANHIQSCSCSPPSGTIREYLSISAGSIPFGHSTCGYWEFAPFGDDKRVSVTFRRFHSLRSFHPRLFTFAPFGDGRMLLATLQLIYFLNA